MTNRSLLRRLIRSMPPFLKEAMDFRPSRSVSAYPTGKKACPQMASLPGWTALCTRQNDRDEMDTPSVKSFYINVSIIQVTTVTVLEPVGSGPLRFLFLCTNFAERRMSADTDQRSSEKCAWERGFAAAHFSEEMFITSRITLYYIFFIISTLYKRIFMCYDYPNS